MVEHGVDGVDGDLALDAAARIDADDLEVAGKPPEPMPHRKRPCASWSSMAMRCARWNGLWFGRQLTPVPSLIGGALEGRADEDVGRGDVLPLGGEVLADPGLVEAEPVEVLDLVEVGLERLADVRAWRMHRHHEVAVPHAAHW